MTERMVPQRPKGPDTDREMVDATATASPNPSWLGYLLQPVDPSSVAVFRMLFGLLLASEALSYIRKGWILRYYSQQNFPFRYYGFEWVQPMSMQEMHGIFLLIAMLGLMVAAGFFYRIAAPLFFLGLTYWFLLDMSGYLNHMYLVSVYAFLLIFIPTHRGWSLDSMVFRHSHSGYFPRWGLWVLRLQMGLVYFYGAIAKISRDWLVEGEPLRTWLGNRSSRYAIGPLLESDFAPWFFSWSGFLIDLVAFPLLLWKRTRLVMFLVLLSFHLTNHYLFNIGIFPFLSIAATLLFFGASWPRVLLKRRPWSMPQVLMDWRVYVAPALLVPVVLIQVFAPLRHHIYPGDVTWTEEGHRFSWRMKLRTKRAEGYFMVQTADMRNLEIVRPEDHLPAHQLRTSLTRPDMILQFAHHLARDAEKRWGKPAQVFAHITCQLNHHEPQPLIDPTVDLAQVPRSLAPADWILPFKRSPMRPTKEEEAQETVE